MFSCPFHLFILGIPGGSVCFVLASTTYSRFFAPGMDSRKMLFSLFHPPPGVAYSRKEKVNAKTTVCETRHLHSQESRAADVGCGVETSVFTSHVLSRRGCHRTSSAARTCSEFNLSRRRTMSTRSRGMTCTRPLRSYSVPEPPFPGGRPCPVKIKWLGF